MCSSDLGQMVQYGDRIAEISGKTTALLGGERVALNLLQRLSGIATRTRKMADKIQNYPARIIDTRKTTPGLRELEKYAVRIGGGRNHRFGLYDGVMIKDNHIVAGGGKSRYHYARQYGYSHHAKGGRVSCRAGPLGGVRGDY